MSSIGLNVWVLQRFSAPIVESVYKFGFVPEGNRISHILDAIALPQSASTAESRQARLG